MLFLEIIRCLRKQSLFVFSVRTIWDTQGTECKGRRVHGAPKISARVGSALGPAPSTSKAGPSTVSALGETKA